MSFENAYAAVSTFYLSTAIQILTRNIGSEEVDRLHKAFYQDLVTEHGKERANEATALFDAVDLVQHALSAIKDRLGERGYAVGMWWVTVFFKQDFADRVRSLSAHKELILAKYKND